MYKKISIILGCLLIIFVLFNFYESTNPKNKFNNKLIMFEEVKTIRDIASNIKVNKNNCSYTANGLAKCFDYSKYSKTIDVPRINANVIKNEWGTIWVFVGDGQCLNNNSCYVNVKFNNIKGFKKKIKIPLLKDNENYIYVDWKKEAEKLGFNTNDMNN